MAGMQLVFVAVEETLTVENMLGTNLDVPNITWIWTAHLLLFGQHKRMVLPRNVGTTTHCVEDVGLGGTAIAVGVTKVLGAVTRLVRLITASVFHSRWVMEFFITVYLDML